MMTYVLMVLIAIADNWQPTYVPARFPTEASCNTAGDVITAKAAAMKYEGRAVYICLPVPTP